MLDRIIWISRSISHTNISNDIIRKFGPIVSSILIVHSIREYSPRNKTLKAVSMMLYCSAVHWIYISIYRIRQYFQGTQVPVGFDKSWKIIVHKVRSMTCTVAYSRSCVRYASLDRAYSSLGIIAIYYPAIVVLTPAASSARYCPFGSPLSLCGS